MDARHCEKTKGAVLVSTKQSRLVIAYGSGDDHGFPLDEPDFACLADEVAETRDFVFVFGLERAQMSHHHAIQECRRIRIVEAFTKHDVPLG